MTKEDTFHPARAVAVSRVAKEVTKTGMLILGISVAAKTNRVVLKVGMVGDSQIGKTSLMVKYVEGSFE